MAALFTPIQQPVLDSGGRLSLPWLRYFEALASAATLGLGSVGTATTVLHGNASGVLTFSPVNLSADVSGRLPLPSLAEAPAGSVLLGRGQGGAGDYQPVTLGAGLTMTGTTLSAPTSGNVTGPGTATDTAIVRYDGNSGQTVKNSAVTVSDGGVLTGASFTALTLVSAANLLRVTSVSVLSTTRTLAVATGDSDRTLTVLGNPTLDDWFNQAVKVASTPTFAGLLIAGKAFVFGANDSAGAGYRTVKIENA